MRLNRKGTKVLLDNKTKAWGVFGSVIQFGIPFGYLAYRYDLFTFENSRYALTGWGMVGVVLGGLLLRNRIVEFVKQYNMLGVTAQRAKWGHVFLTIFIVLAVSSFFINAFLWFFGIVTISNYLSLKAYQPYDNALVEQKEMQKLLKEQKSKTTLERLQELQAQKGITV